MMTTLPGNVWRFIDSNRAVAALEFAMIMPVLLLMFLGSFDAGNAIAVYAKVRAATYSLAAITNQYGDGTNPNYLPISTTIMTAITGATGAILAPYASSGTTVVISQIKATSATAAVVSWSYAVNGTALTPGAPFTGLPTNFAANTCNGTLSVLRDLRPGELRVYADVWRFSHRADHAGGQPVHHAARQHLRAVQRHAEQLLSLAQGRYRLKPNVSLAVRGSDLSDRGTRGS